MDAKQMGNEKYFLNLSGEYRVAAELLKHGIFATVTLGNMKGADVIATGANRRSAVIEVKTSRTNRFVTRFFQKFKTKETEPHPDFCVLCAITPNAKFNTERAFVLTHEELMTCQARRNCPNEGLSWEQQAARAPTGVDNVCIVDVEKFEDRWEKIVDYCSKTKEPAFGAKERGNGRTRATTLSSARP